MIILMIVIIPDEAAVFSVLSNCCIADHISVFVKSIEIKYEKTFRIKEIVHQLKGIHNLLILQHIIYAVTDTYYGPCSAVKVKLPHILFQVHDIEALFLTLHSGKIQHVRRQINSHNVIAKLV